jgi:hypothetical protein
MGWETVKSCYVELQREVDRLKGVLGEAAEPVRTHEKHAPTPTELRPIAVTRATKKAFTQVLEGGV